MSALTQEMMEITASILQEWANEATFEMQRLLESRKKANKKYGSSMRSNLSESIDFAGTKVSTNGATLVWDLNDYWMYIDLGVKGVRNKDSNGNITKTYQSKEFPSGFRFRNLGVPPQMRDSLQRYIRETGIKIRESKKQKTSIVIENSFKRASQMGYFIKRKGIDGTRFYSDVFNEKGFKKLTDKLGQALGQEIEITIITNLKK